MTDEALSLEALFRAHRKRVWAIVYRMTGSAADAEDLVQDAFVKALDHSPEGEIEPWLVRVAVNAGIDLLRRRRRTAYVGPWLPEPIDTGDDAASEPASDEPTDVGLERRYDMLESATFAFLIALEALSPRARAVLLLRDVFDLSVAETASALDMSESHVKVTHHRARRVMDAYDARRVPPTQAVQGKTRAALAALMSALVAGDANGAASLLAADVLTLNDSAGEHTAARVPIRGREKVALFWTKISQHENVTARIRMLNGLPALDIAIANPPGKIAPRTVLMIALDEHGRIRALHGIVAQRKLAPLGPVAKRDNPR